MPVADDILDMSDEDFLKSFESNLSKIEEENTPEDEVETETPLVQEEPEDKTEETTDENEESNVENHEENNDSEVNEEVNGGDPVSPSDPNPEVKSKDEKVKSEDQVQTDSINYEEMYKKIMAPFKANGKMIELNSPEEVIQLMQQGANYTRKMQDIQPHRKVLMMLENNDLLDTDKLSFLIDLNQKNPEAIKKLIKDANIDPLEIDNDKEPEYRQGNHTVSDEEVRFKTVVDDITSKPNGVDTISICSKWDDASKDALWREPEILDIIYQQKENGIFDIISAEIEKQKLLGKIPLTNPFLLSYKTVGDALAQEGKFDNIIKSDSSTNNVAPLATKVAQPKPKVNNGDKVSAAAPTKASPKKAEALVNPLAMKDDEFLATFKDRF